MDKQRIKQLFGRAEVYTLAAGLLALIYAAVVHSNIAGIRIYSVPSEIGAFYTVSVPAAMAIAMLCMAVSAIFWIRRYSPSQRTRIDETEKAEVTVIPKAEPAHHANFAEVSEKPSEEERYLRGGARETSPGHGWEAEAENHRQRKCSQCSETVEADAKFCKNCGAILGQWVKEEG